MKQPNHGQDNPVNEYNQPLDAPVSEGTLSQPIVPWRWGLNQKIQSKQAKFSRINIKTAGSLSTLQTILGTISNGSTQVISDTLLFSSPHGTEIVFAFPYISVYEGTAISAPRQIYPQLGGSQSYGSYAFTGGNDYQMFSTASPGSVIAAYTLQVHNSSGATGTYLVAAQYKYLNFTTGTVTHTLQQL